VNRLKTLYEEASQEASSAVRERNGLKQQCQAAIRQWDSELRERNEYKEALGKVGFLQTSSCSPGEVVSTVIAN